MIGEEKCAMTTHRYGNITGRYVIYRGENTEMESIHYLNVEDYLKSLKRIEAICMNRLFCYGQ